MVQIHTNIFQGTCIYGNNQLGNLQPLLVSGTYSFLVQGNMVGVTTKWLPRKVEPITKSEGIWLFLTVILTFQHQVEALTE